MDEVSLTWENRHQSYNVMSVYEALSGRCSEAQQRVQQVQQRGGGQQQARKYLPLHPEGEGKRHYQTKRLALLLPRTCFVIIISRLLRINQLNLGCVHIAGADI